jgi:hypothetical protein
MFTGFLIDGPKDLAEVVIERASESQEVPEGKELLLVTTAERVYKYSFKFVSSLELQGSNLSR